MAANVSVFYSATDDIDISKINSCIGAIFTMWLLMWIKCYYPIALIIIFAHFLNYILIYGFEKNTGLAG